jgi:hypothetical protein
MIPSPTTPTLPFAISQPPLPDPAAGARYTAAVAAFKFNVPIGVRP